MQTTALLERIGNGRTDLVEPLLASVDGQGALKTHGAKLLEWSSYFGDVTACRLLLRHGLSLTSLGADLGLSGAAFHGHWKLCEFMIESGANACYTDAITGETPLHAAVSNHDRLPYDLVVKVLLRAGADPNAVTIPEMETGAFMRDCRTRGETPLHRAAVFGTPETIEMLLAAGADRERKDARCETPLSWASWARRPTEVLRPLLYGPHRIHAANRPMRANLLGTPDSDE